MRNVLLVALVLLPLGGCGLPPALSIASLVMDAGSYAASGKSMTDHGISIVADRDCALLNIVSEGSLCREEQSYETAVAALEPLPGTAPEPVAGTAARIAAVPFLADGLPRSGEALRPGRPQPSLPNPGATSLLADGSAPPATPEG